MVMMQRSRGGAAGRWLVLLAVLALGLSGGTALGTAPRVTAQPAVSVEGTWLVRADPEDPAAQDLVVFAPGGILIVTNTPVSAVEPDEAPPGFPTGLSRVFQSQGYGVWASLGGRAYSFKFHVVLYDPEGHYLGLVTISGRFMLDVSGTTLGGDYSFALTARDGTTTDFPVVLLPFSGTRVTVDGG